MAVVSAKLTDQDGGSWSVDGDHRYRTEWVCLTDTIDTAYEVLSSTLLPRLGDPFSGWTFDPLTGLYVPNVVPLDDAAACVMLEPRRDPGNPLVWRVACSYEGKSDPLAILPDVRFGNIPYQEAAVQDIWGQVVCNSALDPYRGGMPIDKGRTSLTIIRPVRYDLYDPDLAEQYKNTLNLTPYRLSTLVRAGVPIDIPPGFLKLTELTADRVIRTRNANSTGEKYYWMVRAQIDWDRSTYFDGQGRELYTKWQAIFPDVGFHERVLKTDSSGKQFYWLARINAGNGPQATEEQLLDGKGRKMIVQTGTTAYTTTWPDIPSIDPGPASVPVPAHDWFATRKNQTLTVLAPGVLANDRNGLFASLFTSPSHGTVTFNNDGSFVYIPTTDFVGWDSFTYQAGNDFGFSEPAKVYILVGALPEVRVFQRYKYKDWNPPTGTTGIAHLIGGW